MIRLIAIAFAIVIWATGVHAREPPKFLDLGINLDWWFRTAVDPPRLSEGQLQTLSRAGFQHLRFPVGPRTLGLEFAGDRDKRGLCPADSSALHRWLKDMRAGLQRNGLGLVLTLDANTEPAILDAVAMDDSGDRLVSVLDCMLSTARSVDPGIVQSIVFSPFSEPRLDRDKWSRLQKSALDRVAEREPAVYFLATAGFPTRIWHLLKIEKSSAPNVGYEFHFYEPYLFTMQGMQNQALYMRDKSEVSLGAGPSDCTAIAGGTCVKCVASTSDEFCREYSRQKVASFGPAFVAWHFEFLKKWAAGRFLYMGEYGVHKGRSGGHGASKNSRAEWLSTVSKEATRYGIGRAVYELTCGMGLTTTIACSPAEFARLPSLDLDADLARAVR